MKFKIIFPQQEKSIYKGREVNSPRDLVRCLRHTRDVLLARKQCYEETKEPG